MRDTSLLSFLLVAVNRKQQRNKKYFQKFWPDRKQPSAKSFNDSLQSKFNIAYIIAKEQLPFIKYRLLLLLYKMNGVDIGPTYDNDVKRAEFTSVICDSIKSDLGDPMESSVNASIINYEVVYLFRF